MGGILVDITRFPIFPYRSFQIGAFYGGILVDGGILMWNAPDHVTPYTGL